MVGLSRMSITLLFVLLSIGVAESVFSESISGRIVVRDQSGLGLVEGVSLPLIVTGFGPGTFGQFRQSESDENGGFQFELTEGRWQLANDPLQASGGEYLVPMTEILVDPANPSGELEVTAVRTTSAISGSVATETGTALPNVQVVAFLFGDGVSYNTTDRTDVDGHYSVRVFPGDWVLHASALIEGLQGIPNESISVLTADVEQNFIVQIASPQIEIQPEMAPEGIAGQSYAMDLAVGEESGAFEWALASDSQPLPPGLVEQ